MLYLKRLIIIISILFISSGNIYSAVNSQSMYEQGIEAFKSGNFGSSELLLRKIIDSGETEYKDKAWYYMALSIFNQKKYQSAIFEFNRFLSSCSTSDLCTLARYWIAESHYQLNDNIRAIQEFNRFISQSKSNEYIAQSYDRIGRIYFTQNRYDEAIIEWMKSLAKCEDPLKNNQKRLNIGEAYFLNENYDEAINFLLPILNSNIDARTMAMAKLLTGRAYQIKGKHLTALKTFSSMDETLLTEKPFNEVQYYRALSYIALGNINFASLHLKTFLSTGKESKWIYYAKFELAKIYLKENNIKEATQFFEEIRSSKNDAALKSRASMELSKIYFDNNIDEAIKCLKEASALESPDEKKEALLLLSKAYTKVKNFTEAESILEQLINNYSFDKNVDSFYFMLATVYFEEGNLENTKTAFTKLKEINPFSKYINESYYYLALSNVKSNPDESITLFNKYIYQQKTEKKYDAYIQLLNLYSQKRDFKNSERIISFIIENYSKEKGMEEILYNYSKFLIDNHKPAKYFLDLIITKYSKTDSAGEIFLAKGDEAFIKKNYTEAEYFYKQYLAVHWRQNASSVFLYRILSLEKLKKYKEIISTLDLKDLTPPMDDFTAKQLTLLKGRSYYNTGDFKKAYDSYSSWRLSDLTEEDILSLIKSSIKVEDILTAKKAAEIINNNKDLRAEGFYEIALYFMNKNDHDDANDYLTRIIIEIPSSELNDFSKAEIADIFIKKERYEEAIQKLKEIKVEKLQARKNALLITAFFRSENEKEAIILTNKFLKEFIKSQYSESVIKENLIYYYKIKNINEFNVYSQYLSKYPGNNIYLNYLTAKINFELSIYKTAYFYYYKLADVESEYKNEAVFYLGLISLLNNNDINMAQKYFNRISGSGNSQDKFAMLGKIDLSILSSESGNVELSKKALFDIMDKSDSRILRIQAENLIEYFGYINTSNIKKK
jgi:tetratricopeptide (TPR) repeat protein